MSASYDFQPARIDFTNARLDLGCGTRKRTPYKAIQYMAAGVPVVCDDVGVSRSVVGHESAGSD